MPVEAAFFFNNELWVTDGTASGTHEIAPTSDSYPSFELTFGNQLIWSGYNGDFSVSDGTSAGTTTIQPTTQSSSYYFSTNSAALLDGKVLIAANGLNGLVLTDGTQNGTSTFTFPTVPAPFTWNVDSALYSLGNKAIFAAGNTHATYNGQVTDLWVSDGTAAGTMPIAVPGQANSGLYPTDITVFGNKALFLGQDTSNNNDALWVTDGTVAGTSELSTLSLPGSSYKTDFLTLGNKVLFQAYGADNTYSLWVTDGTDAGTQELKIPLPANGGYGGNTSLYPDPVIAFGNRALIVGEDGSGNTALWVTDGTTAGSSEISVTGLDLRYTLSNFFVYGNDVLFEGTNSVGKQGLWITDGTSAGTHEITPSNVYFYGLEPQNFALAGARVVFTGMDAAGNRGLWTTDGTNAGTYEITQTGASSTGTLSARDLISFGLPSPSISGTLASQKTTSAAPLDPFSRVVISDPNANQTETVQVSLSSAQNGTLSNLGGGSYDASTGVYTVAGSASAVSTALNGLVFTPTTNQAPPGQSVTTSFTITVSDSLGSTSKDLGTSVVATAVAIAPKVVNNTDGSSYLYTYFPTNTVSQTIATYSGANNTGSLISDIVDSTDGSSLLYAYNPSSTVVETAAKYSATDSSNGAPTGSRVSEVVDNKNGTVLVYAYHPSTTVTQTTQQWSTTNPSNGAPSGSEVSDVVDNADGSSLLYSYNPSSTVLQTVERYSSTNVVNGAPSGAEISDVVDKTGSCPRWWCR